MEWFASLYLNSTDRYDDFEWYEITKKKPEPTYKQKMRDKRKRNKIKKRIERQNKQIKLRKYVL